MAAAAKRAKTAANTLTSSDSEVQSVRTAMAMLRGMLPAALGYGRRLPPLLLQHQLYWLLADRTRVDRTVVSQILRAH